MSEHMKSLLTRLVEVEAERKKNWPAKPSIGGELRPISPELEVKHQKTINRIKRQLQQVEA